MGNQQTNRSRLSLKRVGCQPARERRGALVGAFALHVLCACRLGNETNLSGAAEGMLDGTKKRQSLSKMQTEPNVLNTINEFKGKKID